MWKPSVRVLAICAALTFAIVSPRAVLAHDADNALGNSVHEHEGYDALGVVKNGAKSCVAAPGTHQHCAHVFACMGQEGEYFWGQARGWGEIGLLRGKTSVAHCSGFWQRGDQAGMGKARINCSDGIFANVFWNKVIEQDQSPSSTPSFQGSGGDSLGRVVVAWTGSEALSQMSRAKGPPVDDLQESDAKEHLTRYCADLIAKDSQIPEGEAPLNRARNNSGAALPQATAPIQDLNDGSAPPSN